MSRSDPKTNTSDQPEPAPDAAPEPDPEPDLDPDPDAGPAPGVTAAPAGPATRLAEPGQRLVARIIDLLAVGLPVVMTAQAVLPRRILESLTAVLVAGLLVLYETVQLAFWGRTLGKRAVGIGVVAVPRPQPGGDGDGPDAEAATEAAASVADADLNAENRRPAGIGVFRSFVRAMTYALPIALRPVPFIGGPVGFLWVANAALIFEGSDRLALHDRIARTKVVVRR